MGDNPNSISINVNSPIQETENHQHSASKRGSRTLPAFEGFAGMIQPVFTAPLREVDSNTDDSQDSFDNAQDVTIDQWTQLQTNLKYENYWLKEGETEQHEI
jgi:hypothetical protein